MPLRAGGCTAFRGTDAIVFGGLRVPGVGVVCAAVTDPATFRTVVRLIEQWKGVAPMAEHIAGKESCIEDEARAAGMPVRSADEKATDCPFLNRIRSVPAFIRAPESLLRSNFHLRAGLRPPKAQRGAQTVSDPGFPDLPTRYRRDRARNPRCLQPDNESKTDDVLVEWQGENPVLGRAAGRMLAADGRVGLLGISMRRGGPVVLAQGDEFAGYRIERLLGVGGMGEVYLAQDRDLPRPVALKLLGAAVAGDPGVRARFQREADTAARLAHPNIVSVYARGEYTERLWIAMEYVDGTDIAALLGNSVLAPDYAVWVLTEAARALDHAHQHNILHRDVKPANILLSRGPQPRVLLADFGIAKALDESVGLTRTGEVYASFRYAAPEQFDPSTGMDGRADVYALAGTFHHMLTGAPPFSASTTAQLIHSHLNLPVPPPSCRNPGLPPGFDSVVARGMAKNPQERFGSCGEFAAAAAAALRGVASPVVVAAPTGPVPRVPRRRRWIAVTAAAFGAIVLVGGVSAGIVVAMNIGADARQVVSEQDSKQALEVRACEIATIAMTSELGKTDEEIQAMIDNTTGSARATFERSRTELVELMQQAQGTSRVSETECFFKSGDERTAEVLFTGNRTVTNVGRPEARTTYTSMTMTLEKVDGRWLCSNTVFPES